jgi:hypothetical protein
MVEGPGRARVMTGPTFVEKASERQQAVQANRIGTSRHSDTTPHKGGNLALLQETIVMGKHTAHRLMVAIASSANKCNNSVLSPAPAQTTHLDVMRLLSPFTNGLPDSIVHSTLCSYFIPRRSTRRAHSPPEMTYTLLLVAIETDIGCRMEQWCSATARI